MIITAICSIGGVFGGFWFYLAYKKEQEKWPYNNEELNVVMERFSPEAQDALRRRKMVLTQDEMIKIDPAFKIPILNIPSGLEPDM